MGSNKAPQGPIDSLSDPDCGSAPGPVQRNFFIVENILALGIFIFHFALFSFLRYFFLGKYPKFFQKRPFPKRTFLYLIGVL